MFLIKSAITITIFAISLSAMTISATEMTHESYEKMPYSVVKSPRIPKEVSFAGEKVNLDPVHMWERYDRELTAMAYTHGNTLLAIKRANRYFPVLAPILKKNGIPADMIYLAVIESTLNPRALSAAKAGGLWQFMPSTAREYGLEVNEYVDERYDPVKATEAACRYLRTAYSKYGKWESVAASYNGGQGRISNELSAQGVDSAYDLYLADETMRYIFRLLAMKRIMEHPKEFGYRLTSDQLYQPMTYDIVEVSTPVADWSTWAKEHGIDYMTLRDNNPWIRAKSLPNKNSKTYYVNIPTKDSLSRSRQKKTVYNREWVIDR